MIYQLKDKPVESQYAGSGRAWAAIKDGDVVGIRYMHEFRIDRDSAEIPDWCKPMYSLYDSYMKYTLLKDIGNHALKQIKQHAISSGHPEKGPRGGQIKATAIAIATKELWMAEEDRQFGAYREKCRSELAELGEVVSGMCSCYEFVAKND